jgi:hypothetical protein
MSKGQMPKLSKRGYAKRNRDNGTVYITTRIMLGPDASPETNMIARN